jgi:hypothetical protein
MTYGTAFLVRRDNDEVSQVLQNLFQGLQPFGFNPVVVR